MSDVLQKMLSVEKKAQAVVAEAEAEAEAVKAAARREAQKEYERLLGQKVQELDRAGAEERERSKKLRQEKNRVYGEELSRRRRSIEEFQKMLASLLFTSRA